MPSDDLMKSYIESFLGYGNLKGPYWFVGIEEGGGKSWEEFEQRLRAWEAVGKESVVDLRRLHQLQEKGHLFSANARIQPTWRCLIQAVLTARGEATDRKAVRAFQTNQLGTLAGEVCLLELYPLPCRRQHKHSWVYAGRGGPAYLDSKEEYQKHVVEMRCKLLKERIDHHEPVAVTFYGRSLHSLWQKIVGEFAPVESCEAIERATTGKTSCFLVPHPMAHGNQKEVFRKLGDLLKEANQVR